MSFSKRHVASLATVSLAALVWSGCEAKQQTEYVAGVSTQVKVPRDLTYIRLNVSVGGVPAFCRAYRVYDGRVQLPRSLGTFAENDPKQSGPLTYQVIGYTKKWEEGEDFNDFACADRVGEADGARILRRSRQPYIENQILFLPMPLKYSCYDVPCGDDQTCKGGVCVDAATNPDSLRAFTPELADGTGADCFSLPLCLGAALPAIPVKLDDCTFAVPNTPSTPATVDGLPNPFQQPPGTPAPGEGLNVEVSYDGGYVKEVLDKDPDEGFIIPDATKPQQFRLAPGLCQLYKGVDKDGNPTKRRITGLRASPTCQPKSISQPLCQGDAFTQMGLSPDGTSSTPADTAGCSTRELTPPPSGLVVVIDDSAAHARFFGEEKAVQRAISLAVADPAFYRAKLGLVYSAGPAAPTCNPPALKTEVALGSAPTVAPAIGSSVQNHTVQPAGTIPRLDLGLEAAFAALQGDNELYRRAVIVIAQNGFEGTECSTQSALDRALAAKNDPAKSVQTYVFDVAGLPGGPLPAGADQLAANGGTVLATDARDDTNKQAAIEGFQTVLGRLATCVYDDPATANLTNDHKISYQNPFSPDDVKVLGFDAACTVDGPTSAGNGWGRAADGKIVLCGQACADYQTTLKNAGIAFAPFGQPAPAIPVFAHSSAACAPKP